MKLTSYLKREKIAKNDFAKQIGVATYTLDRYLAGRVPEPRIVETIYSATNGQVKPNDFYNLAK